MNTKNEIDYSRKLVSTKYVKGGKEVVYYNTTTGECVLELHKGNEVKVKSTYNIIK